MCAYVGLSSALVEGEKTSTYAQIFIGFEMSLPPMEKQKQNTKRNENVKKKNSIKR